MTRACKLVDCLLSENEDPDINDFMRDVGTQSIRLAHGAWVDGPDEQPGEGDHAVQVHTVKVRSDSGSDVKIGSILKIIASIDTVQAGNYVAVVYPYANIPSISAHHYSTLGWKYTNPLDAAKAIISAFFKE